MDIFRVNAFLQDLSLMEGYLPFTDDAFHRTLLCKALLAYSQPGPRKSLVSRGFSILVRIAFLEVSFSSRTMDRKGSLVQRLARFSTCYLHTSAPVYATQTKEVTIHHHGSIKNKKKTLGIVGICGFDWFAMDDEYRKLLGRC